MFFRGPKLKETLVMNMTRSLFGKLGVLGGLALSTNALAAGG